MKTLWIVFTMWLEVIFSKPETVFFLVAFLAVIALLLLSRKRTSKLIWIGQFSIECAALVYAGVVFSKAYPADDILRFLYISIPAMAVFGILLIVSIFSCLLRSQ